MFYFHNIYDTQDFLSKIYQQVKNLNNTEIVVSYARFCRRIIVIGIIVIGITVVVRLLRCMKELLSLLVTSVMHAMQTMGKRSVNSQNK